MSWLLLVLAIGGDSVGTIALARAAERRRDRRRPAGSLFGLAVTGSVVGM